MNLSQINSMAMSVSSTCFIVYGTRISMASLRDNVPEICRLALKYKNDSDPRVFDGAAKLLALLVGEGVDPLSSAREAPVQNPTAALDAPTFAAAPTFVKQAVKGIDSVPPTAVNSSAMVLDWQKFEDLTVRQIGPLGARIVQKQRDQNPGMGPKSLRAKLEESLGKQDIDIVFSKYSGS